MTLSSRLKIFCWLSMTWSSLLRMRESFFPASLSSAVPVASSAALLPVRMRGAALDSAQDTALISTVRAAMPAVDRQDVGSGLMVSSRLWGALLERSRRDAAGPAVRVLL